MIGFRRLRALLSAASCCALLSSAWVSQAADAPAAAHVLPASGFGTIATWDAQPCSGYVQTDAPALVQVAATLPGSGPAPGSGATREAPVRSLQQLAKPSPSQINGPITFAADQAKAERNGRMSLSGDVDVHMSDRRIQADQMIYDRNTGDISVSGEVRYSDPTVKVQGDTGHYGNEGAQFTHAQFRFLTRPGYGSANDLSMTPSHIITLRGVTYTSCPPPRADWDIRARELRLDTNVSRGVARGARVDFQGIPVMYFPYLSFPLSAARQSGLLFPNLGSSSRDGLILGVPWYWNIAPNQDATFTPTYYSSRGLDLGAQYRFLSAHDSGTFDGDFMPHDRRYDGERNYASLLDRLELGHNTRLQTDVQSVSDTEYFEDFSQGTQPTSTPFLPRSLELAHRDDIWNLQLQLLGYETLDDSTLAPVQRPYMELPRLSAASAWSPRRWSWLSMGFDGELADFTRPGCGGPGLGAAPGSVCTCPPKALATGCLADPSVLLDFPRGIDVTGWRASAQPHIGLDIAAPGYFVRPQAAWQLTQYALRGVNGGDPNPTRSLPILSFDSGLRFERLAGLNGTHTVTLEPRLMYVYIPYRDQSELPLFDTSTQDPNLIELFRPNRYVGIDRIGDANQVTVGVTSEMFSTATGSRYLSATIGQSLYLSAPRVTLPGQILDPSRSDLIGELELAGYRNWNVLLNAAASAAVSRIEQAEAALQYRPSGQEVINFGYQYRNGQFQQLDSSLAWPILQHWDVYARAVYSLLDHASIQDFAGFQYRGACWGLQILWQRSISTRTGERDTGFSVQLELTGLSSVGSQVATFLQQSIRGYSAGTGRAAAGRLLAAPPAR